MEHKSVLDTYILNDECFFSFSTGQTLTNPHASPTINAFYYLILNVEWLSGSALSAWYLNLTQYYHVCSVYIRHISWMFSENLVGESERIRKKKKAAELEKREYRFPLNVRSDIEASISDDRFSDSPEMNGSN